MEHVSIQIPASLFAAYYNQYHDQTTAIIVQCLSARLNTDSASSDSEAVRYPRPKSGTKTGRVWEIADEIERKTGRASREAVIRACMEEDLNINTASTQYSYWKSSKA